MLQRREVTAVGMIFYATADDGSKVVMRKILKCRQLEKDIEGDLFSKIEENTRMQAARETWKSIDLFSKIERKIELSLSAEKS